MTKLVYSEVFDSAWKSIKQDLPLVAGLTLVSLFGAWVLNLIPFVGLAFSTPFLAGYLKCLLQIRKGEIIGFSDFLWGFQKFNRFLHLVLLGTLLNVGAVIGFILLIIPGIWWSIATVYAGVIFILKKEDGIEPIKLSIALVKDRWWNSLGLALCIALLNILGVLFFMIGVLVSAPISVMALVIAAEKLIESSQTEPLPLTTSVPLETSVTTE